MKILARSALLILAAALIQSCRDDDDDDLNFVLSPYGYWVSWEDQGTVTTGLATLDEIYALHALAVDQAVDYLATLGVDRASAYAAAYKIRWRLVDNCAFYVPLAQSWATGAYYQGFNRIDVALYVRVEGPVNNWPPDTPPWTIRLAPWDPTWARWGVLDRSYPFPATGYELSHYFGFGLPKAQLNSVPF